jgi:hypothetical protein
VNIISCLALRSANVPQWTRKITLQPSGRHCSFVFRRWFHIQISARGSGTPAELLVVVLTSFHTNSGTMPPIRQYASFLWSEWHQAAMRRFIQLYIFLTQHRNIAVQQDQPDAQFAFSLLRLIASTCLEHLFVHHREALYVKQLVYCFVYSACSWWAKRCWKHVQAHYNVTNLIHNHFIVSGVKRPSSGQDTIKWLWKWMCIKLVTL